MAKQTGAGSNLFVDQYDVSGDIGAINSIVTSRGLLDVTGLDKSAFERILGLRDGAISYTAFWNTDAGQAHIALSSLPTTDRVMSLFVAPLAVGSAAASIVAKETTYAPTRGQDGSLKAGVNGVANANGLEWSGGGLGDGMLTTGKQTFASGTQNGTSVDYGSTSTLFGAAAYLHVFSLGSGTPTVTIADSANDSTFTPITDLAFSPTVAYAERLQTATNATIRRYVRVQITGTYTNLICAVNFVRYTETIAT